MTRPFSIADPLPSGTTVLEASAGTGKTWAIGALVTRYVAAGHRLDEILVITFGRAASQEMRERVRGQLVAAEAALRDPVCAAGSDDPLIALLASGSEVGACRRRLQAALAEFDSATIATTHQFCQLVLRSLGTAGDSDGSAELVEDVDDLLTRVVDDLYLTGVRRDTVPPFTRSEAVELARIAVDDPQSHLLPAAADPRSVEGRRVRFAVEVRRRLRALKREVGVLGFDDLIDDLAGSLEQPDSPARALMRSRWSVVLVDEFQDTDPQQWSVLERAFHGRSTLVLIGDPKQAIYAFRGGDVVTYLRAVALAHDHRTLQTNWRSDGPLVQALQATFAGAELGDRLITVGPVEARHTAGRLAGLPHPAPFRLRTLTRERAGVEPGRDIPIGQARTAIAADLAGDIAELLASGATFDAGGKVGVRPLAAGDVAVLVSANSHAAQVQRALADRNIASVLGAGTNVLASAAADLWITFLEALAAPSRSGYVRAAALGDFFGHDAAELAADGDAITTAVSTRLRELAELLDDRGISAVFESVSPQVSARVLARVGGARRITDLRHIAHLLHEAELRDRLGPAALLQWLHDQREHPGEAAERTRRLDSDDAAVQVVTIHRSKGLQYPVVYLPFLFDRYVSRPATPRFHDDDGLRSLDIGGHPDVAHVDRAMAEDAGEALRLTYVAMTRAQCQLVAWWAPTMNARNGGLHRLLFRAAPEAAAISERAPVPDDATAAMVLQRWQANGAFELEPISAVAPSRGEVRTSDSDLSIRHFHRKLDTLWRRTSYTALTRFDDHTRAATSEPEDVDEATTDESQDDPSPPETTEVAIDSLPSPMAELPTGTGFGSLVHAVFELADFTAPDLPNELLRACTEQASHWGVDADPAELAAALLTVSRTPLGPRADDLTLAQLLGQRQLKELDFELPLAGGDHPSGATPRLGDLADLLRAHLPAHDPLRPFAERLTTPLLAHQAMRGYLTGSLDLGLRLSGDRFLVVDYKTNWLGRFDAPLTLSGYAPLALTTAMLSGTYPLQAMLYCVVLHRYLRWRLRGYDPERHLSGVLYLYVRGMAGSDAPRSDGTPYGVFSWRPPAPLVLALSDLLDGRLP